MYYLEDILIKLECEGYLLYFSDNYELFTAFSERAVAVYKYKLVEYWTKCQNVSPL